MNAKCSEYTNDPKIKLADHRSSYALFINDARERFRKTQIDGCIVNGELASDWLLQSEKYGALIVELKGRNVGHAMDQIMATIRIVRDKGLAAQNEPLGALIVSNCGPKIATTKFQQTKAALSRQSIRLTISSSTRQFFFSDLIRS